MSDVRLHDFPFIHTVAIEVTSKCNLQCTYCMVSQPGYRGRDMAEADIAALLPELRARQVDQLCINGHGETTARKGWHEMFRPLVDEFRLSIITNLARKLGEDEIDLLSRIDSVNVSLDTVDPALLRELRRSLDFDVVLHNLLDIRACADRRKRSGPQFILYAGVYDKNVMQLEALAAFAADMGFSRVVFWSLVKHPDVPGALNVDTLLVLGPDDRCRARDAIQSAIDILDTHQIPYEFVGDFFEVFKREIAAQSSASAEPPPQNRIFAVAGAGTTKECFDPWNYSQIKADGEVYPCCAHGPVGRIDNEHSYKDILDGAALKNLRRRLLTGDLDEVCRHCHMRRNIPVPDFQAQYLSHFKVSFVDPAPIAVPPWRAARDDVRMGGSRVRALRSLVRNALIRRRRPVLAYLDAPAGGFVSSRQLEVRGWCFSPRGLPVTGQVFADGIYCGDVEQTRARPDLQRAFAGISVPLLSGFAKKLQLPDAIQSGRRFSLTVQLDAGTAGRKTLRSGELTLVDGGTGRS